MRGYRYTVDLVVLLPDGERALVQAAVKSSHRLTKPYRFDALADALKVQLQATHVSIAVVDRRRFWHWLVEQTR